MLTCPDLRDALAKYINDLVGGYEEGQTCVLTVPWIDSLGEPLRIVVTQHGDSAVVDDDGTIFFATGRLGISSEPRHRAIEEFTSDFLAVHGLTWNKEDQVAEMVIDAGHLTRSLMNFGQTVGACLATLPVIVQQQQETPSDGRSLGPRLATKINRQFVTWIKQYPEGRRREILRRVKRRQPIEGVANPRWMVDFFYEPLLRTPAEAQEPPVVLITVDLGVKEPLFKAEHAVTMSRDIVLTGHEYTVRLAFAGDGRNGDSKTAREIIKILSKDTYLYYDLDDSNVNRSFINMLRSEVVGEPWL